MVKKMVALELLNLNYISPKSGLVMKAEPWVRSWARLLTLVVSKVLSILSRVVVYFSCMGQG